MLLWKKRGATQANTGPDNGKADKLMPLENMREYRRGTRGIASSEINRAHEILLGHGVSESTVKALVNSNSNILDVVDMIVNSREYSLNIRSKILKDIRAESSDDFRYSVPNQLSGAATTKNILLIGSCMLERWLNVLNRDFNNVTVNHISTNNGSVLPSLSNYSDVKYDFQIVQVPLRSVMPEALYFNLKADDESGYEAAFQLSCNLIDNVLKSEMAYNEMFGLQTFVLGFITPQQNPMGRLHPRHSLANMSYFIQQLNSHLYKRLRDYRNSYFIDIDEIASIYGKKYICEDSVTHQSHGSLLGSVLMEDDGKRLEDPGHLETMYLPKVEEFISTCFHDILACHASISQSDAVKLVIFDIDDTLWRGIAAEMDQVHTDMAEGWPLGIVEAAAYLWKRGIMIAIVSKNDEAVVRANWATIYGSKFSLDNFVALRINWKSKAENVEEILSLVNVTASNVLFVDDNPVERSVVKTAFPDIRVMDAPLLNWRRILMWSAETQPAVLTAEAANRTEMVQKQIKREEARSTQGRDEFLASLNVTLASVTIDNIDHPNFERCFELINKTNQFNSTGRRWNKAEMNAFFEARGEILAGYVEDRFSNYGLVVAALVKGNHLEQMVMSCRVFGMGIEQAFLSLIKATTPHADLTAAVQITEKNAPARQALELANFIPAGDGIWKSLTNDTLPVPSHVSITGR